MRRQAISISASRGLGSAIQALTIVLFGRTAGLQDFGIVMAFVGLAAVAFVVADFGMTNYTSKSHALGRHSSTRSALRFNVWAAVIGAVALGGGVFLLYGAGSTTIGLTCVAIALAIEKNSNTLSSIPLAERRSFMPTASFMIRRVLALGLFSLFTFIFVWDPTISYGLSMLLGSAAGQVYLRAVVSLPGKEHPHLPTKQLILQAWPYFVGNFTMQIKSLDTTIVAAVASAATAGLYAAASKLTAPFLLIPTALTQIILPRAATMDHAKITPLARRLYLVTGILLVAVAPFVVFREWVMTFLMGDAFAGASDALAWTLLGIPFFALSSSLGALLQGRNDESFVAINGVIFAIFILGAAALGAWASGATGAALVVNLILVLKAVSLVFRVEYLGARSRPDAGPSTDPLPANS